MAQKELVIFESEDKAVSLSVPFEEDTVWLNRLQMATLFDRDVKTIGKHVQNAIEEKLSDFSVVANFATTAAWKSCAKLCKSYAARKISWTQAKSFP